MTFSTSMVADSIVAVFAVPAKRVRLQRVRFGAANGDHRLLGKGLDQCDLCFVEATGLAPRQRNGADHSPLVQQRHTEQGSNDLKLRHGKIGVRIRVADVIDLSALHRTPGR